GLFEGGWSQNVALHARQNLFQSRAAAVIDVELLFAHRHEVFDGIGIVQAVLAEKSELGQASGAESALQLVGFLEQSGSEQMHAGERPQLRRARVVGRRGRKSVPLSVGILRPRLHHDVRLESPDDIAASLPVGSPREPVDMIGVSMGGDDGVELAIALIGDVAGHALQVIRRGILWTSGAAKIEQEMSLERRFDAANRIMKRQQEAVTE